MFYRSFIFIWPFITSKYPEIAGIFTIFNSKLPEIAGVLWKLIRKTPEIAGNFGIMNFKTL